MHSELFGTARATVALTSIQYPKRWRPQPDITIYELALCAPILNALVTIWRVDVEQMIGSLPVEAQRHFTKGSEE